LKKNPRQHLSIITASILSMFSRVVRTAFVAAAVAVACPNCQRDTWGLRLRMLPDPAEPLRRGDQDQDQDQDQDPDQDAALGRFFTAKKQAGSCRFKWAERKVSLQLDQKRRMLLTYCRHGIRYYPEVIDIEGLVVLVVERIEKVKNRNNTYIFHTQEKKNPAKLDCGKTFFFDPVFAENRIIKNFLDENCKKNRGMFGEVDQEEEEEQ